MAQYKPAKITTLGQQMMAQDLNNEIDLQFTRIVFGNGTYTEQEYAAITARTALKSQKQSIPINRKERKNGTSVEISGILSNLTLEEGYQMSEIGVYAKDSSTPDATEQLYLIIIADTVNGTLCADYMPAYNGIAEVSIEQVIQVDVVDADEAAITPPEAVLVTQTYLEQHHYNKSQMDELLGGKMNYAVLESISTLSALNGIATNTDYADGNYTLLIPIASGNIIANLDIGISETAIMTFHGDYVLLYFPYNNKTFRYSESVTYKWVRVYADIEPNTVPRKVVFNNTTDLANLTLIDDLVDYDIEVNVVPSSGSTIFPVSRTFKGRIYTHAFQSGTNTLRNQFLHTDRGEVFLREKDYNAQSWTSWRKLYVDSLPKKHAHFNDTLANTATKRGYIVNNQDEVGRLYISGTDFIEFVDLEATTKVEVLDMIDTTHGAGAEVTMLSEPSGTYYIQTWHKAEGEIVRRFKIGSGTYSAWVSTTPAAS